MGRWFSGEAVIMSTALTSPQSSCVRVDMGMPVELICAGNELLIGKISNTNAQWLAKRVTSFGLHVQRILIVSDDVDEISHAFREALHRHPRFLITTGGLGPTFDDKTLEGLAKGLERGLEVNDEALQMIKDKYQQYVEEGRMQQVELTPHRVKMAKLPEGAEPLPNPVGTAPGVAVQLEGTTIIALPGVPSEMKAIFEASVLPLLRRAAGNVTFYETSLEATNVMESASAPVVDRVMHENPYVYIKSHPKGEERIHRIEFHLSTTAETAQVARSRVGKALIQLSEAIQEKGGKVKPIKTET
jgi:nicotinamide-nucleotide amidase